MDSNKTYPVPVWVRVLVCLTPFVIAGFGTFILLTTGRGYLMMGSALALCALAIRLSLTKH